jgi:hypothetical protein
MANGIEEFKRLLTEFRGLSVWAVGGGVAVPFVAAMTDLSPPWPPAIVPVTAVIELLSLVLVFQFLRTSKRRLINWILSVSVALFVTTGLIYLLGLSLYTYEVPTTKERFVKGYECTSEAKAIFGEHCPDLGLDELRTAEYEADRLWTRKSIAFTRSIIVFVWLLVFAELSFALGSFLVYQMRAKRRATSGPARTGVRIG